MMEPKEALNCQNLVKPVLNDHFALIKEWRRVATDNRCVAMLRLGDVHWVLLPTELVEIINDETLILVKIQTILGIGKIDLINDTYVALVIDFIRTAITTVLGFIFVVDGLDHRVKRNTSLFSDGL